MVPKSAYTKHFFQVDIVKYGGILSKMSNIFFTSNSNYESPILKTAESILKIYDKIKKGKDVSMRYIVNYDKLKVGMIIKQKQQVYGFDESYISCIKIISLKQDSRYEGYDYQLDDSDGEGKYCLVKCLIDTDEDELSNLTGKIVNWFIPTKNKTYPDTNMDLVLTYDEITEKECVMEAL